MRIIEGLKKIPEKVLSNQSKDFLILNNEQQVDYLETRKDLPQKRYADIACMTILKMSSVDKYAMSCLVIGSEDGDIIILDPQTFSQLSSVSQNLIFHRNRENIIIFNHKLTTNNKVFTYIKTNTKVFIKTLLFLLPS